MEKYFGRAYDSVGTNKSDLMLKTLGQIKIQYGNKFLDLIKDGKINTGNDSILIVKTLDDAISDGIYFISDTLAIYVVVLKNKIYVGKVDTAYPGLILKVYKYNNLDDTFDSSSESDTFNAFTIAKIAARIASLENSTVNGIEKSVYDTLVSYVVNYILDLFLSKVKSDTSEGTITFRKNIIVDLLALLYSATFGLFIPGMEFGKGGYIDNLGNAEFESITVRSYIKAMEYIINKISIQSSTTIFSESGKVEKVLGSTIKNNVSCWHLLMKKDYNTDYILFVANDIIKGQINKFASMTVEEVNAELLSVEKTVYLQLYSIVKAFHDNVISLHSSDTTTFPAKIDDLSSYTLSLVKSAISQLNDYINNIKKENYDDIKVYPDLELARINIVGSKDESLSSVYAKVVLVDNDTNSMYVYLYPDSEVPANKNGLICLDMVFRRFGNTDLNSSRTSCWYISSDENIIMFLHGVTSPILKDNLNGSNYGGFFGLPPVISSADGNKYSITALSGKEYDPNAVYLYAKGVICQEIIHVNYLGVPILTSVNRGEWKDINALSPNDFYSKTDVTADLVTHNSLTFLYINSKDTYTLYLELLKKYASSIAAGIEIDSVNNTQAVACYNLLFSEIDELTDSYTTAAASFTGNDIPTLMRNVLYRIYPSLAPPTRPSIYWNYISGFEVMGDWSEGSYKEITSDTSEVTYERTPYMYYKNLIVNFNGGSFVSTADVNEDSPLTPILVQANGKLANTETSVGTKWTLSSDATTSNKWEVMTAPMLSVTDALEYYYLAEISEKPVDSSYNPEITDRTNYTGVYTEYGDHYRLSRKYTNANLDDSTQQYTETKKINTYPLPELTANKLDIKNVNGWVASLNSLKTDSSLFVYRTRTIVQDGIYGDFETPLQISGANGLDGADGVNIHFCYCLTASSNIKPDPIYTDKSKLPTGTVAGTWTDHPMGISYPSYRCEWVELLTYNTETKEWESWSDPRPWSVWGETGLDGDGIEYIFILSAVPIIWTNPVSDTGKTYEETYLNYDYTDTLSIDSISKKYIDDTKSDLFKKEYLPTVKLNEQKWLDDPVAVTKEVKYEYISLRSYTSYNDLSIATNTKLRERALQVSKFSTPTLWSYFGLIPLNLKYNNIIGIPTNSLGIVSTLFTSDLLEFTPYTSTDDGTWTITGISVTPNTFSEGDSYYNSIKNFIDAITSKEHLGYLKVDVGATVVLVNLVITVTATHSITKLSLSISKVILITPLQRGEDGLNYENIFLRSKTLQTFSKSTISIDSINPLDWPVDTVNNTYPIPKRTNLDELWVSDKPDLSNEYRYIYKATRYKVNSIWGEFQLPVLDYIHFIGNYNLTLSNDTSLIITDSAGLILTDSTGKKLNNFESTIALYLFEGEVKNITLFTLTPVNLTVSCTYTYTDGTTKTLDKISTTTSISDANTLSITITPTDIGADIGSVKITVGNISSTYTVSKNKNGEAAEIYSLKLSESNLKVDKLNNWTVKNITATVVYKKGSNVPIEITTITDSTKELEYWYDTDSSHNTTKALSFNTIDYTNKSKLYVRLREESGEVYDEEILDVIKDGIDGDVRTSYVLYLDNLVALVSCNSSGIPITTSTVSSGIKVYKSGADDTSNFSISCSDPYSTISSSSNNNTISKDISPENPLGTPLKIKITATNTTDSSISISTYWTIFGFKLGEPGEDGKDGKDAVTYNISSNPNVITILDNKYQALGFSPIVTKSSGTSISTLSLGTVDTNGFISVSDSGKDYYICAFVGSTQITTDTSKNFYISDTGVIFKSGLAYDSSITNFSLRLCITKDDSSSYFDILTIPVLTSGSNPSYNKLSFSPQKLTKILDASSVKWNTNGSDPTYIGNASLLGEDANKTVPISLNYSIHTGNTTAGNTSGTFMLSTNELSNIAPITIGTGTGAISKLYVKLGLTLGYSTPESSPPILTITYNTSYILFSKSDTNEEYSIPVEVDLDSVFKVTLNGLYSTIFGKDGLATAFKITLDGFSFWGNEYKVSSSALFNLTKSQINSIVGSNYTNNISISGITATTNNGYSYSDSKLSYNSSNDSVTKVADTSVVVGTINIPSYSSVKFDFTVLNDVSDFNSATSYDLNSVVLYNNAQYICIKKTTQNTAFNSSLWKTYVDTLIISISSGFTLSESTFTVFNKSVTYSVYISSTANNTNSCSITFNEKISSILNGKFISSISISGITATTNFLYLALSGSTSILGGLVLSNVIAVKNSNDAVTAYLNGLSERPALAAGVTNFGTGSESYLSGINFDGSAKFGNLSIDSYGTVGIADSSNVPRVLLLASEIPSLSNILTNIGTDTTSTVTLSNNLITSPSGDTHLLYLTFTYSGADSTNYTLINFWLDTDNTYSQTSDTVNLGSFGTEISSTGIIGISKNINLSTYKYLRVTQSSLVGQSTVNLVTISGVAIYYTSSTVDTYNFNTAIYKNGLYNVYPTITADEKSTYYYTYIKDGVLHSGSTPMISGVLLSGTITPTVDKFNDKHVTYSITNLWGPLAKYVSTRDKGFNTNITNGKIFLVDFNNLNISSKVFLVFATARNNDTSFGSTNDSSFGTGTNITNTSDTRVVEYLGIYSTYSLLFIVSDGSNARTWDCTFDFMLVGDITKVLTEDLL